MITDLLVNSNLYYAINPDFKKAFEFIKTLNAEIPNGTYQLSENMIANVMEYQTNETFKYGWESHRKFIDIQYCLRGQERIQWTPLPFGLNPSIEYDEVNDRIFYSGKGENTFIDTGNGIFAIFFPNDAHAPQIYVNKPEFIKKIVVKVSFL